MAHFYGTLQGSRGEATRCGTRDSGVSTVAASWQGAVEVELYAGRDGVDRARVILREWQGRGLYPSRTLYDGPVNGGEAPQPREPIQQVIAAVGKFYRCGGCDHFHPLGWAGDCRDDGQRFREEQIEELYGREGIGWTEVEES